MALDGAQHSMKSRATTGDWRVETKTGDLVSTPRTTHYTVVTVKVYIEEYRRLLVKALSRHSFCPPYPYFSPLSRSHETDGYRCSPLDPLESEEERGKKGSRAVSSDFEELDI
jgi:hypothetical protein